MSLLSSEPAGALFALGWVPVLWNCNHRLHVMVGFFLALGLDIICSCALYCYGRFDNESCTANVELA